MRASPAAYCITTQAGLSSSLTMSATDGASGSGEPQSNTHHCCEPRREKPAISVSGDDDHPRRCRNRADVLAAFARGRAKGLDGEIGELRRDDGILCGLIVEQAEAGREDPSADRLLYHVYFEDDNRIAEIHSYDDRESAALAAGILE